MKISNLLSVFLFVLLCGNSMAVSYTFSSGWNLFSPVISSSVSIDAHLSSIGLNPGTDVLKIWSYDASNTSGPWTYYAPNDSGSTLTQFEPGKGYWVNMAQAKSANLSDSVSGFSLSLAGSGWKLFGLSSSQASALDSDNFLQESNFSVGTIQDIRKIYGFTAATSWRQYSSDGATELTALEPGFGYWMYVLSDVELNSQNISLSDLFPPTCPGCPSIGN